MSINTDEERAYSIIGIVKQKKELHKEAIIDFKKCLSFNPNNYDSLFGLAECFL